MAEKRDTAKIQFLISAPTSGSGKTTIAFGVMRLLKDKGYEVQPFKCGPDYLDVKHHTQAAGQEGYNLDTFMMSDAHVKHLFATQLSQADVAVVEGMMGLFDGYKKSKGSSAEIAGLLNLPVILVINAQSVAYAIAPLLYGYKHFDPEVNIAGVIFNFVNSKRHYTYLKEACEEVGLKPLGYLPKNENLKIPSRHLGLNISDGYDYEKIIGEAAKHIEKHLDWEYLTTLRGDTNIQPITASHLTKERKVIAVARDGAFNFTYQENLSVLKTCGEIVYFSPLHDTTLPEADLIYLAGGYPELYLKQLSENVAMKKAIKTYCEAGGALLAECGGMMYLGKHITDQEGNSYDMAEILDIDTTMEYMKLSLGYRTVKLGDMVMKGHEFHYSTVREGGDLDTGAEVFNARGGAVPTRLYGYKNVLASYVHFYWGEDVGLIEHMLTNSGVRLMP